MTTQPTQDPKCDCVCHSPKYYAPHKTGHACCDEANVIEDNSLLVKTTNIATPATKPLDELLDNLTCANHALIDDDCVYCNDTAIKALIANAEKQARIDEWKRIGKKKGSPIINSTKLNIPKGRYIKIDADDKSAIYVLESDRTAQLEVNKQ